MFTAYNLVFCFCFENEFSRYKTFDAASKLIRRFPFNKLLITAWYFEL